MSAGYSGTPLAKKLGIKENFKVLLCDQPSHYFDLFSDMPNGIVVEKDITPESTDFVHLFCTTLDELKESFNLYKVALKKTGMLWVSWPKGSSKISTDLKRDVIREYGLDNGLVDVKVAAVDADWSGLKFVYRTKDR